MGMIREQERSLWLVSHIGSGRRAVIGFAALALFSLLGMCGSMAASPNPLPASPGCGKRGTTTGILTLKDKDANGVMRSYLIQIPSSYQSTRAYPLIFVFHGFGGNAGQSFAWGLQNARGAAQNGIFVFPQAAKYLTYGVTWDDRNEGVDFPFFDTMLKEVEASYCIDPKRVFVAGFSAGGDYVTALACRRGDSIRAMAANSTTDEYRDIRNYMTFQNMPCTTHNFPAIRFEHALGGDSAYPPPDFATTSQLFQYFDSCTASSHKSSSSSNVSSCTAYDGCKSNYIECSFDPRIGHALPPSWAQDTWDFFSSFQ